VRRKKKGIEHERLWSYILSLESSEADASGGEGSTARKGGNAEKIGGRLWRLGCLATRYGRDPRDVINEKGHFFDRGAEFIVYDFKPGRNTFIDAVTGEIRFIDPRVAINDPGAGFAVSRFGKRRIKR